MRRTKSSVAMSAYYCWARGQPSHCRQSHSSGFDTSQAKILLSLAIAVSLSFCQLAAANEPGQQQATAQPPGTYREFMENLRQQDECGAIYHSKMHGYDLRDYKIITDDKYELHLHRIIHPADIIAQRQGRKVPLKKPYLLVHGLLGTSAGFITNTRLGQAAPMSTYDLEPEIEAMLRVQEDKFEHYYSSTADQRRAAHVSGKPDKWAKNQNPKFASTAELNFENDQTLFASAFRQAHRKFRLSDEALKFSSNSLAFTLANYGYDVWLINMRGNYYSRKHSGRLAASHAEYWDFNIQTLVREDLLASIDFIKRENKCPEPIGLVSYSYSSIHVLNMLTKFPTQLTGVQPVIMMAPTLLTANSNPDKLRRAALRAISKLLIAKNGPFPSIGRGMNTNSVSALERLESHMERMLCKLPVFSKFCRLLETILHGRTKRLGSVKSLLVSDRKDALLRRENDCGQTSTATLHQIMENLREPRILPQYQPQATLQVERIRGKAYKRSVILVHSLGDEISTPAEVKKLREFSLRDLTLVDYMIESKDFGHSDFLFSEENQYLVNAEIARMAAIYDFMLYKSQRVNALPVAPGSPGRVSAAPRPQPMAQLAPQVVSQMQQQQQPNAGPG